MTGSTKHGQSPAHIALYCFSGAFLPKIPNAKHMYIFSSSYLSFDNSLYSTQFFHSLFTGGLGPDLLLLVTGCVEVRIVDPDSETGVYTPEEHFPKLSPCSALLGIGG